MGRSRRYTLLCIVMLLSIALISIIYRLLDTQFAGTDINLINRGIDTPAREWLNGYLGLFFRFKFLGNINWLVLPIIILYFLYIKTKRWESILLLAWLFIFFLVMSNGYFNMRYQITLLPLTIVMLLYASWKLFDRFGFENDRYIFYFFLAGLLVFNDIKYFMPENNNSTKAQEYIFGQTKSGTTEHTKNYRVWINPKPEQMFAHINLMDPELPQSGIMVNNLPSYYYYTGRKGVYYWCHDDIFYSGMGEQKLFQGREDFNQVSEFIKDSLQCGYILSSTQYEGYNTDFDRFLLENCRLVFKDPTGYILYSVL